MFEFWERKLLGAFKEDFAPGALPSPFNSQVFVIREEQPRPQVLSSSRHITAGGYDLERLEWTDGAISGESLAVAGEPYEIYMTEPAGWRLDLVECGAAPSSPVTRGPGWVKGGCAPSRGGPLAWRAQFTRERH